MPALTNSRILIRRTTGHPTSGFTLIEILVALVIISIVLGIVLLRLNVGDFEKQLQQEAARLAYKMQLADQQAIFEAREYGLLLQQNGYRFEFFENNKWQPADDPLLSEKTFTDNFEMILTQEGIETNLKTTSTLAKQPQIVFFSSGEWTPFELSLRQVGHEELAYVLNNTETGELKLERIENPI